MEDGLWVPDFFVDTPGVLLYTPLYRYVNHLKATLEETVGLCGSPPLPKAAFLLEKI